MDPLTYTTAAVFTPNDTYVRTATVACIASALAFAAWIFVSWAFGAGPFFGRHMWNARGKDRDGARVEYYDQVKGAINRLALGKIEENYSETIVAGLEKILGPK